MVDSESIKWPQAILVLLLTLEIKHHLRMKNIEDMKTPVEVKKIPEAEIAPKRMKGIPEKEAQTGEEIKKEIIAPVSYTHLTLPTILLV